MSKHVLTLLTLALLLAGCGGSKNLASDHSGNRDYNDGYMTSETRSAQHVDMKDTDAMSYQNFEEYIQARVGGVDIDGNGNLVIRGMGTFNGSSKPLILMDGSEVLSTQEINPNEIHSIDVLKDASSTAAYGMRGANGVIVITSKAAYHAKQAEREARKK